MAISSPLPVLTVLPGFPVTIDDQTASHYSLITDIAGDLTISGSGTVVTTDVLVNGVLSDITVDQGAVFNVDGLGADAAGTITIGGGGTVVEGNKLTVLAPVNFTGNTGTLVLDQNAGVNLNLLDGITGFQAGDGIELNQTITSATYDSSNDTLVVKDGNTVVTTLALTGTGFSQGFTVTNLGNGSFDISVACFLPGTMMLTDCGEVPASQVAIGDRLVTLSGEAKPVKWIGRRSYSAAVVASDPHVAPVTIRRGALGDELPSRDLHLSPCHAMFLDGILVESGHLVNDASILREPVEGVVEYINFEFEDHEVIFADGAAAETGCCRGDRAVYDNAAGYAELYPHEAPNQPKPYCAPRLDCGFEVEAIRRRIDARAGLSPASDAEPGALRGWIEHLDAGAVRGVASNAATTAPVLLELVIDGAVIGRLVANHARPARLKDGLNLHCGFHFKLPEGLSPYLRHTISVRRASDQADLPGSPFMLEAATKLTAVGRETLAAALENAVAAAGSVEEVDRALDFMVARAEALLQAKADLAGHRAERTAPLSTPGWSRPVAAGAQSEQRQAA